MIELRGITWDHVRGVGGLRAAAQAYRAVRPDVSVTWHTRSLQAFADQPVNELAGSFDLIVLDHPSIGEAVARDALACLDDRLDPEVLLEQAHASVGRSAESYVWEDRRWALAVDAAAQVAAFRPDLLEEAGSGVPRTWEDVEATGRSLRGRGRWIAMPAVPTDAICMFLAVCRSLGTKPCADPERVVPPEVGAAGLDLMRRVIDVAHPASLAWNPPRTFDRMASGDEVVYVPLAFGYASYARPEAERRLRFVGGPAGDDGAPRGTLGGAGIAVSARSDAPGEAAAFAAFASSAEIQQTAYVRGGGQPGHRAAWTDPEVNAGAGGFYADTLGALEAAYLRPRHDGFLGFQQAGGDLVHAWLRGDEEDPRRVLADLDASYRASFARRSGVARS